MEVREERRGVCLCQEYECLSASYAKSFSVFVCGVKQGQGADSLSRS